MGSWSGRPIIRLFARPAHVATARCFGGRRAPFSQSKQSQLEKAATSKHAQETQSQLTVRAAGVGSSRPSLSPSLSPSPGPGLVAPGPAAHNSSTAPRLFNMKQVLVHLFHSSCNRRTERLGRTMFFPVGTPQPPPRAGRPAGRRTGPAAWQSRSRSAAPGPGLRRQAQARRDRSDPPAAPASLPRRPGGAARPSQSPFNSCSGTPSRTVTDRDRDTVTVTA